MLSAAQATGIGNVPAGMRRFITELTEPKMNWREILTQQIESQIKNDFTFARPGRRSFSSDAILPSMKREPAVEVTIAIDLSGSIGEPAMKDFMSEVVGILQQHSSYKITILTWDCSCYFAGTYTEDDGEDAVINAPMKGGGGTSPGCIWQWCEENEHEPKQLVIFTDGYIDSSANSYADIFPTVWLGYKNPSWNGPHGVTCHYD